MNVQHQSVEPRRGAQLDELEILLEQTAALVDQPIEPAAFNERLVEAFCRAAGGRACRLWTRGADKSWQASASTGNAAADASTMHAFADAALRNQRLLWVSPGAGIGADGPVNATDDWLLVSPVTAGRALELVLAGDEAHDRGLLSEVAKSFAEIAGDFFESRELGALRHQAYFWKRLEAFVASVHRSLEVGPTAYAIVNDGRLIADCDRLSMTIGRGRRVVAVSGIDNFDRRSDAVNAIGELAAAAVSSGENRWDLTDESATKVPVKLARAWNVCRQSNGVKRAEIAVLRDVHDPRRAPIGTLVAEWFETEERSLPGLESIVEHAQSAIGNALHATPGPVGRIGRWLGKPFRLRSLPRTVVFGTLAAGILCALCFWPAEFTVDARGRARPAVQRDVFAPRDGVVRTLRVGHGDKVTAGTPLLLLADPSLDLDFEQVLGDIRTARQRLLSIQAARTTATGVDRAGGRLPDRTGQLAGEEKEIGERLAGLEKQLQILEHERTSLTVASPIDGVVLTWETDQRLEARPVRRGQRLLTVAQPAGEWMLELDVPDRKIGHVLAANESLPRLEISYLIATDPTVTHRETVDSIAISTEPHSGEEPSVRVTARVDSSDASDLRPGSTVVAKIHCGERPIGYVWFHDLFESLRSNFFF